MFDAYGTKNGFLAQIPRQNGQRVTTIWRGIGAANSHGHVCRVSFVAHCAVRGAEGRRA